MAGDENALGELLQFARDVPGSRLTVHDAQAVLDERQDGEPVLRLTLVLDDPPGDTWDVESVAELRHALARRAVGLDLPPLSLTLVPKGEAGELLQPTRT